MKTSLFIFASCLLLIFLPGCEPDSDKDTDSGLADSIRVETPAPQNLYVYAWVDDLRIRTEPGLKSTILLTLSQGDSVLFLNERSDFTEKIALRGTVFDDPWLKVKLQTGKEGWIFGGGVKFYRTGGRSEEKAINDWTAVPGLRVGPVSAHTSLEDLKLIFGQNKVVMDTIWFPEGMFSIGTAIFPGTLNELEIVWADSGTWEHPSMIRFSRTGGKWQTPEGIAVGTGLEKLRMVNAGEFTFSGFGWDYGGAVTDWESGEIWKTYGPDAFALELEPGCYDCLDDYAGFYGDIPVRSDKSGIGKIKVKVSRITIFPG
jgi:hypothetical protein